MWINIKDKLPDLKKFKDGDSINGRYEKIRTMHYSYNDEYKDLEEYNEPYGLMHYEESEPVLVKYKCHFLEDKIKIGIGVAIKYQFAPTLLVDEGTKKIFQMDIKTEFMLYTPDFEDSALVIIKGGELDVEIIEEQEIEIFEWMHLPKI